MFSREMPDWKFLSLEHMRPIREMLLRPAAGLRFAPKTIDTVLERMISLPKLDGFEAVSLFFSILNDLATAPPDEVQQIGSRHDGSYQDDRVRRIVRFVEESYSRKLSLEEIGRSVDMSPSSVCRYFKRRTHQNLWEYINSFRINRAAQLIVETQLPISEIGPRCGFTNVSNFNHLFRAHLGTTPSDYRSRFKTSPLTPDTTNWENEAPPSSGDASFSRYVRINALRPSRASTSGRPAGSGPRARCCTLSSSVPVPNGRKLRGRSRSAKR